MREGAVGGRMSEELGKGRRLEEEAFKERKKEVKEIKDGRTGDRN